MIAWSHSGAATAASQLLDEAVDAALVEDRVLVHLLHGVAQRDRCVREAAGVEDHALAGFTSGVKRIDEFAFVVALESLNLSPELGRTCRHGSLKLLKRQVAVHLRVALAQEVQVGAVDEGNFGHH